MNSVKVPLIFLLLAFFVGLSHQGMHHFAKNIHPDLKDRFSKVGDAACKSDFAKAEDLFKCFKPPQEISDIFAKCRKSKEPRDPKKSLAMICAIRAAAAEEKDSKEEPSKEHKQHSSCIKDDADKKKIQAFKEEMKQKPAQEKILTCLEKVVG